MNRRNFVKTTATTTMAGMLVSSIPGCTGNLLSDEYDKYGGWTGKRLSKTGFFHTEHNDSRWWFVTPEGNAFLSFGINHYHAEWWMQEYNRDHWNKTFGAKKAGDEQWGAGFRKVASADMNRLGINTLGWHTDAVTLTDEPYGAVVPYLRSYKPIVLDHYQSPEADAFVDVFSPEFEELCDETAQEVAAPYVNDPMLLGYCMSDCPIFTDDDIHYMSGKTSWSRILLNLGKNAPGKQVYVRLMQKHYSTIEAFNESYNTSFTSWDELIQAENWKENTAPANESQKKDNQAFTLLCVDRYYSVSRAALTSVDPNHLFFGDKLNGNTDNLDKVLEIAAKYADVMVYQFYGTLEQQEALLDKLVPRVDIPFMNGDIGFSSPSEMMPNPYGPHAKDQEERAEWLKESVNGCFTRPEFIGWHMCGIIDTWHTMQGKAQAQHQGIMTVKGEFYPEMEQAVKDISLNMYQIAVNK